MNSRGGVCERQIEIDVQDHGYKPENALPLYEQMKTQDLGFAHLLGSPVLATLKGKLASDGIIAIPGAWASVNLDVPEVLTIGQTYDVEMLNALDYLSQSGAIQEGDTIGHVAMESDLGQNALLGSKNYAEQHGLTIIEAPVSATDTDMTATVTKFKSEGVKAILVSAAPPATGSVALQNVAQGLEVPIVGSSPTFALPLLQDEATAQAMQQHFRIVTSFAPFGAPGELSQQIAAGYAEMTTDPPSRDMVGGYINGMVWEQILATACEAGDLTRAGVQAARDQLSAIDTQGLSGTLDLTQQGAPTTREAYILAVDPAAPDGLKIEKELFESAEAKTYQAPYQK